MPNDLLPLAAKLLALWWLAAGAVWLLERRVWRRDASGFTERSLFWWRHARRGLFALPPLALAWPMYDRIWPARPVPAGWGELAWAVALLAWVPLLSEIVFIWTTRLRRPAASSPKAPTPAPIPDAVVELRVATAFSALSMVFVAIGFETSIPPISYAAAGVFLLGANWLCDVAMRGRGLVPRKGYAIVIDETPLAIELAAMARLANVKARQAVAVHLSYHPPKRRVDGREKGIAGVASAVAQFDLERPILLDEAARALPPGCLAARFALRYASHSIAFESGLGWTFRTDAFLVAMSLVSLFGVALVGGIRGGYGGMVRSLLASFAIPGALLLAAVACAGAWRLALRFAEGLEGQRRACRLWIDAAPHEPRDEAGYVRAMAQLDRFYLRDSFEPEPMVRAIARQSPALIAFFEEVGRDRAMEAIRQGVADIDALLALEDSLAAAHAGEIAARRLAADSKPEAPG